MASSDIHFRLTQSLGIYMSKLFKPPNAITGIEPASVLTIRIKEESISDKKRLLPLSRPLLYDQVSR
jgi:hypothetical protein